MKLTIEELAIVGENVEDVLILEKIKGMSLDEMKEYDKKIPKNIKHYNEEQKKWISTERYLIGQRKGCGFENVSEDELIEDFNRCKNGLRFKVFYCEKFPEMLR